MPDGRGSIDSGFDTRPLGGEVPGRMAPFRRFVHQFARNRAAVAGAWGLLLVIACAVFAPLIAPYDPLQINPAHSIQPPSAEHWFGTDETGRDIFSRVVWGARISLWVGLTTASISAVIGLTLGLVGGYYGGIVGFMILRFVDLLLAFPGILLALVVVAVIGPGLNNVMIAVGIGLSPTFTRVIYGQVLSVKQNDYVSAAQALGASNFRIITRHILVNVAASAIVLFTIQVGAAIFAASSLSFVGLGAKLPTPEWGAMVSRGRHMLRDAMWMSTFPGLAIALVIVSINVFGDGLRDFLDPRTRL